MPGLRLGARHTRFTWLECVTHESSSAHPLEYCSYVKSVRV